MPPHRAHVVDPSASNSERVGQCERSVAAGSLIWRLQPTPRWDVDRKVWMRVAANKPFKYFVSIVEREYDEVRGGWNYTVKYVGDGTEYPESVEEKNLRRA